MWKWTSKEESKPAPPSTTPATPSAAPPAPSVPSREPVRVVLTPHPAESFRPDVAHIGNSIAIKGELSGSEDVYLDGELEGRVELLDGSLIVGPDGRIRGNSQAPQILIRGQVDGNLYGRERVELKKSAVFVGDIYTPRIAIEDGAYMKGNVRSQEDIANPPTKKEGDTAAAKNSVLVSSARREDNT